MIVITGAAGFIGCNLVKKFNEVGRKDLILVDYFDQKSKEKNLADVHFFEKINRDEFIDWVQETNERIDFIFHLGARTDTTEFNFRVLDSLNLAYSKALWEVCVNKQIPLLYASSAATYGMGEFGFKEDLSVIKELKPLNPYGVSKQLFDLFVLEQTEFPPFWVGLKFFNVYGPFEFHKGRMASVIFHAYKQIKETGSLKLFQSHHPNFKDGEQLRDFIFVEDILKICLYFFENQNNTGIYNAGTGKARSFNDLAIVTFHALKISPAINYIPTPEDIRNKYQYFTEADMNKLLEIGYPNSFTNLEEGVKKYVDFLELNYQKLSS